MPFWHIFGQARIFSKGLAHSVLSTYGPTTSYKILQKTNEPIPKNVAVMDEQTNQSIFGHFGQFSGKQEFLKKLGSRSFEYLWSLNFMQNMRQT